MGHPDLIADPGPAITSAPASVAIVHDYLNQTGGAERVALELTRIWPGAPVYTSLYRPGSTFAEFSGIDVRSSPLGRLPVDRGFRALAPLYPMAFRALGTLDQELVVSSSSGWAHGVRTSAGALHIVYCHTPARWLYGEGAHLGNSLGPRLLSPFTRPLRAWDHRAAHRPDVYVANCENVRLRIQQIYGRDSVVVYPPVDVDRFNPTTRGERLLVVSRLLPYKRVDLVVRAATQIGLGLDVVGEGPTLGELRRLAGPTVRFHGRVEDSELTGLMESCRALCVCGEEDFGITPLEALAAGKPVVAYAAGGVLETLEDGVTACLFAEQSVDAVRVALARVEQLATPPEVLAAAARRFSSDEFRQRFRAVAERAFAERDHVSG